MTEWRWRLQALGVVVRCNRVMPDVEICQGGSYSLCVTSSRTLYLPKYSSRNIRKIYSLVSSIIIIHPIDQTFLAIAVSFSPMELMQHIINVFVFPWTACSRAAYRVTLGKTPGCKIIEIGQDKFLQRQQQHERSIRFRIDQEHQSLIKLFAIIADNCPGCAKCGSTLENKNLYMYMGMAFCSEKCRETVIGRTESVPHTPL